MPTASRTMDKITKSIIGHLSVFHHASFFDATLWLCLKPQSSQLSLAKLHPQTADSTRHRQTKHQYEKQQLRMKSGETLRATIKLYLQLQPLSKELSEFSSQIFHLAFPQTRTESPTFPCQLQTGKQLQTRHRSKHTKGPSEQMCPPKRQLSKQLHRGKSPNKPTLRVLR